MTLRSSDAGRVDGRLAREAEAMRELLERGSWPSGLGLTDRERALVERNLERAESALAERRLARVKRDA